MTARFHYDIIMKKPLKNSKNPQKNPQITLKKPLKIYKVSSKNYQKFEKKIPKTREKT
jgi:hypothetical protein